MRWPFLRTVAGSCPHSAGKGTRRASLARTTGLTLRFMGEAMNDWRALVEKALLPENTSNASNTSEASVPSVPSVPPLDPVRAFKACRAGLAGLDPLKPMHGLDAGRWRRLLDDGAWLLDGFGTTAFRDGWQLSELVGLWWHDGGLIHHAGGIADRLDGSRSLKMTADRAHWRCMFSGEPMTFLRTAYPNLKPLWEQGT